LFDLSLLNVPRSVFHLEIKFNNI